MTRSFILSKEGSELQTMSKDSKYPYTQVHFLGFCWDDPKQRYFHRQIEDVEAIFKDFDLTSINKIQLETKTFEDFEKSLAIFESWVTYRSRPNSLLILYYSSHGGIDEKQNLRIEPENDYGTVHHFCQWHFFYKALCQSCSDVVMLLDACHAGAAINELSTGIKKPLGRMDLIVPCSADERTNGIEFYFAKPLLFRLYDDRKHLQPSILLKSFKTKSQVKKEVQMKEKAQVKEKLPNTCRDLVVYKPYWWQQCF
ncbi:hypothetical protein BDZ45DRAFT_694123 [Acephala macrosclerotiorum]|nr:hypothetical protein BDZ45DRAFT_694123 [Acephala macrosclerotiorum]